MILVILITLVTITGGIISGVAYGFYAGGDPTSIRLFGALGLVAGLLLGPIVGILFVNIRSWRYRFDYFRYVDYRLAPCAWCDETGTNMLIFPCRVCGGRGSVLAVYPRRKCAWCRGSGREYWVLRCRVCDGGGWVFGHQDRP